MTFNLWFQGFLHGFMFGGGGGGGGKREARGRKMLPTLAVGWRASALRGVLAN